MKQKQLRPCLLVTGTVGKLVAMPAKACVLQMKLHITFLYVALLSIGIMPPALAQPWSFSASPITEIPRKSEIEQPLTSAQALIQDQRRILRSPVVQVTGVRLNRIPSGLEVILETTARQSLQVLTARKDNILIADILNTQLALAKGKEFRANNPVEGIASVMVMNLNANKIQVRVTGTAGVPTVKVFESNEEGLILRLTPAPQTGKVPPAPAPQTPEPEDETPSATTTPEDEPDAATQKPEAEEEIEIVVTGEQEDGYRVPNATTGTRTDTPLRDIPQSIQVVPQQVLEDQQAIRLRDALRNVSGVQPANTVGNTIDSQIIRGFTQSISLRNGFRDFGGFIRETANVERIEVLKGPASVLYGNLEPGGIVNLVTKQPLSEPFYSAELEVGSFGFVRPTIDLSGPLNSERTLLYRLNAAYERDNGFRDFDQGIERVFVSPVLTWLISDRTEITFEFEYLYDKRPFDRGLVAIGTGVADIPFDRVLGELDDVNTENVFTAAYRLEHRFSENLTLRNAFQFRSANNSPIRNAEVESFNEQNGELSRTWYDVVDESNSYSFQTDLAGKFATGSVQHTLLFGVDLFRETNDTDYRIGSAGGAPSINIFNPVYGTVRRPERDELPNVAISDTRTDILGIYLQDQITLAENLKLLVGGRFDIFDQESNNQGYFGDDDTQQQDEAFTPRIGIAYQPIEPVTLYASYSRSFAPNSATRVGGSLLEPTRGTQYEVGIRGEFVNSRLLANLAAYHLTKSNIATLDPDNRNFNVATGEQRSQGIELDVAGEILPGWNIIASYAYTDAKITEDGDGDSSQEGNIPFGVPFNAASLWTTYEIQSGNLQGFGIGFGLFFVGERQGNNDNNFQVPSYVRTDASIFYRRNNWRAGINFKNLFDVDYIEATQSRTAINPGIPFTVLGTVSVEF